ncbi:DUF4381 domain-containing protein [Aliagarivorans marinus]|uniref:DUF4381 domain-containing protein n=1 Tax=Aliagarivorans marinus TaxID=561965 RepID=UPI0004179115|nr:DUF4381 domain-containing protein [Aliagarivorans marinus]
MSEPISSAVGAQLQDILLPSQLEQGWPAPGWWLLGSVIALLIITLVYLVLRYRQLTAAKREALSQVDAIEHMADLDQLLKQAALAYFPRSRVAGLHGQAWLDFLNKSLNQSLDQAAEQPSMFDAEQWLNQRYRPEPQLCSPEQRASAKRWLSKALPPQGIRQLLLPIVKPAITARPVKERRHD